MPGGSDLRAIEVGDALWAVVETVPQAHYGEDAIARGLQDLDWVGERAMAHERVTEHFLAAPALLPMQLFTMFTSDDRVIEHVRTDRRRIARILKRLDRKVEWGVRMTWDEKAARAKVDREHRSPGRRRDAGEAGSAYLARKRDILAVNQVQLADASREAGRVYTAMSRLAAESQRRSTLERAAPGSRLLLDAAFLVPRKTSAVFRTALRSHSRSLRSAGVAVALTGPWPPYNFIG
jgi:hypothetical protein